MTESVRWPDRMRGRAAAWFYRTCVRWAVGCWPPSRNSRRHRMAVLGQCDRRALPYRFVRARIASQELGDVAGDRRFRAIGAPTTAYSDAARRSCHSLPGIDPTAALASAESTPCVRCSRNKCPAARRGAAPASEASAAHGPGPARAPRHWAYSAPMTVQQLDIPQHLRGDRSGERVRSTSRAAQQDLSRIGPHRE
jgi:hypothetical protein